MFDATPWTVHCTRAFVRHQPHNDTENNNTKQQQQPCDRGSSLLCRLQAQQSYKRALNVQEPQSNRWRSPVVGTTSQKFSTTVKLKPATNRALVRTSGACLVVALQRLPNTTQKWPTHSKPVRKQALREHCSDLHGYQVRIHSLWQVHTQESQQSNPLHRKLSTLRTQSNAQLPPTPPGFILLVAITVSPHKQRHTSAKCQTCRSSCGNNQAVGHNTHLKPVHASAARQPAPDPLPPRYAAQARPLVCPSYNRWPPLLLPRWGHAPAGCCCCCR